MLCTNNQTLTSAVAEMFAVDCFYLQDLNVIKQTSSSVDCSRTECFPDNCFTNVCCNEKGDSAKQGMQIPL